MPLPAGTTACISEAQIASDLSLASVWAKTATRGSAPPDNVRAAITELLVTEAQGCLSSSQDRELGGIVGTLGIAGLAPGSLLPGAGAAGDFGKLFCDTIPLCGLWSGATGAVKAVLAWLTWFFNPAHLIRIGEVIGGAVLLLLALTLIFWKEAKPVA